MGSTDGILRRIKRCAWRGNLRFTVKAQLELELDDLTREDVRESLVTAVAIYKSIRSTRPGIGREYLHIIQSPNLDGVAIYTKGKLVVELDREVYYVLISSKQAS